MYSAAGEGLGLTHSGGREVPGVLLAGNLLKVHTLSSAGCVLTPGQEWRSALGSLLQRH